MFISHVLSNVFLVETRWEEAVRLWAGTYLMMHQIFEIWDQWLAGWERNKKRRGIKRGDYKEDGE